MKTGTIIEIVIIIILAIAFVIYLTRRNIKDEKDTNPEFTKAFEDENKHAKE